MDRESVLFFVWAIGLGFLGSLIAMVAGWGETAVFVAGMGPVAVVMFVFMRREGRQESERSPSPAHRTRI